VAEPGEVTRAYWENLSVYLNSRLFNSEKWTDKWTAEIWQNKSPFSNALIWRATTTSKFEAWQVADAYTLAHQEKVRMCEAAILWVKEHRSICTHETCGCQAPGAYTLALLESQLADLMRGVRV
jgi:hypothetical protein